MQRRCYSVLTAELDMAADRTHSLPAAWLAHFNDAVAATIATAKSLPLMPRLADDCGWGEPLDPLDAGLRREILKYGDLAQATYDAFDHRHWSPHCGTCLHGLRRMLPALGLDDGSYVATAFVYATCDVDFPLWLQRPLHADAWDDHANWIGFVAVAGAEEARRVGFRDIAVVWRGTMATEEWAMNVKTRMVPFMPGGGGDAEGAMVHEGFYTMYASKNGETKYGERSAREQVAGELERLVRHFHARGEDVQVTVTGHSLGGALALLAARDAAAAHPGVPVRAVTFSAPRVGNAAFCNGLAYHGVRVLRVVVRGDTVPGVPIFPISISALTSNELLRSRAYVHAGDELVLDAAKSPHLRQSNDALGLHDLEVCLHLLDGHESAAGAFRQDGAPRRDVALVNKRSGMLLDEESIPASWWQQANMGLVRGASGRWSLPEREHDDLPVPDDQLLLSELD